MDHIKKTGDVGGKVCPRGPGFAERHNIQHKYQLIPKQGQEECCEECFEFEEGELEGDPLHLGSFSTKEELLGNQTIFIEAL
jgi:hypothetical protein